MAESKSPIRFTPGPPQRSRMSFEPDEISPKCRPKKVKELELLCKRHGTTRKASNVIVNKGRKAIHLLRTGTISSINCFRNEPPSDSNLGDGSLKWSSVMVPDGWKSAVVADGEVFTVETRYAFGKAEYLSTFVDDNGVEDFNRTSGWQVSPHAAFDEHLTAGGNGKLLIGCQYENPQKKLRDHFRVSLESHDFDGDLDLKAAVENWLENRPIQVESCKRAKRPNSPSYDKAPSTPCSRSTRRNSISSTATSDRRGSIDLSQKCGDASHTKGACEVTQYIGDDLPNPPGAIVAEYNTQSTETLVDSWILPVFGYRHDIVRQHVNISPVPIRLPPTVLEERDAAVQFFCDSPDFSPLPYSPCALHQVEPSLSQWGAVCTCSTIQIEDIDELSWLLSQ